MNVKITMEIPVEKLTELQALLSSEPVPVPEVPAVAVMPSAHIGMAEEPEGNHDQLQPEPEQSSPADEPVTKSMIRAKGLELTQAGKKAELEAVFKKFGAAKLRDLKEEDYAEAYKLLGEL